MSGRAFAAGFAAGVVVTLVAVVAAFAEAIEKVEVHRARAAAPATAADAFAEVRRGMEQQPPLRGHVR